jgi:XTP/dITP diphosphohydrolase
MREALLSSADATRTRWCQGSSCEVPVAAPMAVARGGRFHVLSDQGAAVAGDPGAGGDGDLLAVSGPVVIATGNPHKVEELRAVFGAEGVAVVGLRELAGWDRITEPAEHGATFEENARIKALGYAGQTGRWCIADDSGLEVEALGGAPGVISSHYATGGADSGALRVQRDLANNDRLLKELAGVPGPARAARFVCVMCLARPGEVLAVSRGTLEGRIGVPGEVPRGGNGFGYDPLFVLPDGRTSAELSAAEKNAASHRGAAARDMARRVAMLTRH